MKYILLIDDEEHEHVFVSFLLKDRYGSAFTLGHAKSMHQAQDYLSKNRVDVILLDDRLGNGQTSADSIPILRRSAFNVPVIVFSKDTGGAHLSERALRGPGRIVDKFDFRTALKNGLLD